jgi:hypothetical protein
VLKAGLDNAEDLTAKVGDILMNTARRTIKAGTVVGNDVREATKRILKGATNKAETQAKSE